MRPLDEATAVIELAAPDDLLHLFEPVFDLEWRLLAVPARGREELLRLVFRDGRIALVPRPGGFYIARGEILPWSFCAHIEPSGERYPRRTIDR